MIRLFLAIFLLSGQLAFAQSAKIRSGEHEDFSRLVISVPASRNWTFVRQPGGYEFSIEGWTGGFDTSEVFELIPRTRLSDLIVAEESVTLQLACDCDALAAAYTGSYVIVDIIDREKRLSRISMDDAVEAARGLRTPNIDQEPAPRLSASALTRVKSIGLEDVENMPDRLPRDLSSAQKELLEGLSRAAGLELIRTSPVLTTQTPISEPAPVVEAKTPEKKPKDEADPEVPMAQRVEDRFRIRSAVDLARGETSAQPAINTAQCGSDKDWEIAAWGDGRPYAEQLAALRGKLVEDISQVNLKSARDLVRLYLHFGLGAEAIQASKSFDLARRDIEIAQQIASIVDGGPMVTDALPDDALNCGANQSMWYVLTHPSEYKLDEAQTKKLTALFLTFPPHLKTMLGPKLITALNQRGNKLAGKILYSAISSSHQNQTGQPLLNAKSTIPELQEIIKRNDETSPQAMVRYLKAVREGSGIATSGDITLAEAYRKQLSGAPVAASLTAELLHTYASLGQFPMAFSMVPEVAENDVPSVVNEIVEEILDHPEKVQVVEAVVQLLGEPYLEMIAADKLSRLATRLVEVGIPSLTRDLIQRTDMQRELASILIQSHISERKFTEADRLLTGYKGNDRPELLATLMLRRGRADALGEATIERLSEDARNQAAWLSGNHELILPENARKAAAERLAESRDRADEEVSLAAMNERLQQSSATRDIVAKLLEEIE